MCACTCIRLYIRAYACVYSLSSVNLLRCVYTRVYMHIHTYIRMYTRVYIHVHINVYTHTCQLIDKRRTLSHSHKSVGIPRVDVINRMCNDQFFANKPGTDHPVSFWKLPPLLAHLDEYAGGLLLALQKTDVSWGRNPSHPR